MSNEEVGGIPDEPDAQETVLRLVITEDGDEFSLRLDFVSGRQQRMKDAAILLMLGSKAANEIDD